LSASNNHLKAVGSVERVYAGALLDMAKQADQLDEVADELEQLGQLLEAQPDLLRLMSSQVLSSQARRRSLEAIFQGRVCDLTYRFLQVVNQKGRLDVLPGIIRAYAKLLDEHQGVVEADVFVAERLSESDAQSVSAAIGKRVGKDVVLHQYIEPGLIGGLKIRVGDQLIDGSVATGLRRMRRRLVETGRAKARAAAGEQ